MNNSRYAPHVPRTPAETLAQSRDEKLRQEKQSVTRLVGRLRWKAELLMSSYFKASEIVRAVDTQQNDPASVSSNRFPLISEANLRKIQAEAMFKVDFFEFYTLLERYITTCLAVFGVNISGSAPQINVNALRYITTPNLHTTRPMASHAFHANLLDALDDKKCPLYASFGVQHVRVELGLAKDFRNAWKNADERMIASKWDDDDARSRKNITLTDAQLEQMLRALVSGAEHAHDLVLAHTNTNTSLTSRDFEPQTYSSSTIGVLGDSPLEFMDDAMDLD